MFSHDIFFYIIVVLSLFNFGRIFIMLLGSDLYDIKQLNKNQAHKKKRPYKPTISIIVPAYNEELGILRTLTSILANSYSKKQIIIVNDGSSDNTLKVLKKFQRKNKGSFTIVSQPNKGKAAAINRAVRRWATGQLIMVVDADSVLDPMAIEHMVEHFRDRRVIASAANVKIIPHKALLGIVQRFEYLISYRMKRASSLLGMEYIVGGVGSTFRKSALETVNYYDTDTMTEDIDVTLKLIRHFGNKNYRIHYAANAIAYTEHVLRFRSLIRQRFRWKYGRMQVLLKNNKLFFNQQKKYTRQLTWYQLPYAIIGETLLLLEPLLVGYIISVMVMYADSSSLLSVYCIVSGFVFLILVGEETENIRTKIALCAFLPFLYFLLYILSVVEYAALIQSLQKHRQLRSKKLESGSWQHVERLGEHI